MGSEWINTEWGELATLEYGKGLRNYQDSFGSYRVYGTNGPIGWHDVPLCNHPGVIIGRKGAYRGVHFSPEPFFVIDTAFYLEPKIDLDIRWAYYQLLTVDINGMDSGSAIPSTSREAFYRLPVTLPPLPEQRAIAAVLGALDDKIELNRRMNGTLEGMARALFKSWFVDFDPVRAKMDGRPAGLPAEIEALFPDRMEMGEDGVERPRGWEVGSLENYSDLNPESWSKKTRPPHIDYLDLSNAKWGRIESIISYTQENAPSRAQRILRTGDTIVGTVRPGNGSYALITNNGLTGSTGFAVLRPHQKDFSEFVYLAATNSENIERLSHLADGGAYPAVRPEVVLATQTIQPSIELVSEFHKHVYPLLFKIAANEAESRTLAALRDGLLPKLMSGEVRVNITI